METPAEETDTDVESDVEEAVMDPGEEPEDLFGGAGTVKAQQGSPSAEPVNPLPGLEEAVARVPGDLIKALEELLRAEFREVIRWNPRR